MLKKVISIGLMGLILLMIGCGAKEEIKTPEIKETPPPVVSPKPEKVQPEKIKSQEITGTYTLCPEAKGKIKLTHRLARGYKESISDIAPQVELEIKNVSNRSLTIYGRRYDKFIFAIASKDKEGKLLEMKELSSILEERGEPSQVMPKEVRVVRVKLFPSDETRYYEIRVGYVELRKIPKGEYVKNPELSWLEEKVEISHFLKIRDGEWLVEDIVTNVSNEPIKLEVPYNLYLKVRCKNAEGKEIDTIIFWKPLLEFGEVFNPGEVKRFRIPIYPYIAPGIRDLEKIKSYELFIAGLR